VKLTLLLNLKNLKKKKKNTQLLYILGHAVTQLVKALRYKPEGRGSIPDGVIGTFHLT